MKVDGRGKKSPGNEGISLGGRGGGRPRADSRVEPPSFMEAMEEVERANLIREISALGESLSKHPSISVLRRYRQLIGVAIEMVRRSLALKRDFKWRRSERAMFVLIERTESALDELEELILREGDRARVLELMEEIKGCLISILS
ncbi:YaaR family protein [Thermanaerovibrio acidaminovorans]|uniref:YaaR family protein n=1 Tax=Thermanaerovibrio acidaminovorans TaxID=81462 RepID=UPI0024901A75|nr:DUF327 family protein [Thermanaerovibrio acidaminovorans]